MHFMLDRMISLHYIRSMNRLSLEKRVSIIQLLVEGNSLRSASRIADVSINSVSKLLVDVGRACLQFHDEKVRGVTSKRIQCDEIWSFVYSKERNKPAGMEGVGDAWTWTAIDADTKLMVSFLVGQRSAECAHAFMTDVADRLVNKERMQLTTDGLHSYLEAVTENFGSQIDFAQLVKLYGSKPSQKGEAIKKTVISGNPDEAHISTSFVERSNLTMRMSMRRFTRSTNAFSKKMENHEYAVALFFVHYNWVRRHASLRVTPAMAAGLTKRFMSLEEIVKMVN
jgi:IS1 family transposase/predicted HTH domain antitoxin